MITLYHAFIHGANITKIEATRVTGACYFTLDRQGKENRNALFGTSFATFENERDAINWLRGELKSKVSSARHLVEYSTRNLNEFNQKYPEQ